MSLVGTLRANKLPACRRLGVELKSMLDAARNSTEANEHQVLFFAVPKAVDVKPLEWEAQLPGPAGTPYAGGTFRLNLQFPEKYPLKPPVVKFVTVCFHPNVSVPDGKVCLNVLSHEWSPLLTVSTLLLCISALLSQPNPEDPLNERAASLLQEKPKEFAQLAREWTLNYAA